VSPNVDANAHEHEIAYFGTAPRDPTLEIVIVYILLEYALPLQSYIPTSRPLLPEEKTKIFPLP
jgi:hypothetical protein